MKPVIALVGRPNVGKSTLFNRLTRSRDALVIDMPGVTRDRNYGEADLDGNRYIVIDTGGIMDNPAEPDSRAHTIEQKAFQQTMEAVHEADIVLFLVDARAGIHPADYNLADYLRRLQIPVVVLVNKAEGLEPDMVSGEFYKLGLGDPVAISAEHGDNISELKQKITELAPAAEISPEDEQGSDIPRIAVVGRPNAGKSTFVNAVLGEERVVVFDQPGTTRDSITIPFHLGNQPYFIIDTAGVRKRGRVTEKIEKFSVVKTLRAIDESHVVVLMIDGSEGITEQDLKLVEYVVDSGRGLVLAVNKYDALTQDEKQELKRELERKLTFLNYVQIHYISALKKQGIDAVFRSVRRAYNCAGVELKTSLLNRILSRALEQNPPPMVHGRRIKPKYAHQGGRRPPTIVIHGNQVNALPGHYRRYLENQFRQALKIEGTPVRLEFRASENPYKRG